MNVDELKTQFADLRSKITDLRAKRIKIRTERHKMLLKSDEILSKIARLETESYKIAQQLSYQLEIPIDEIFDDAEPKISSEAEK